jgi:hypothetical protein
MTKDFLFFNYSWVPNSTFIFKSFESSGYSCDFVDEKNIHDYQLSHKYRAAFLYLHEDWTIPLTNKLIEDLGPETFLIQHDDTDHEHVQTWSDRAPDLIMQRELTADTKNPYSCPIFPMHFPIQSMYKPISQKPIDICFIANMTNTRRQPFVEKVIELAQGELSKLQWYVKVTEVGTYSEEYQEVLNASKIGLHYFGNSYDSWRIWELASTENAIIMPKMRVKSVAEDWMPFNEYVTIKDDFSDLKEKIEWTLAENRWIKLGQRAFDSYMKGHTPEKCFQKYHDTIIKYVPKR